MSVQVTNTTEQDPALKLLVAMGGIEAQEATGQRQVVGSDTLPADLNGGKREDYEALGFVFGDPVPGDPMFVRAQLPPGWGKERSDHAMWSYVVDGDGRRRVSVFYKAAFYDRSAHMNLTAPSYQETAAQADAWNEVQRRLGEDSYSVWGAGTRERRGDNIAHRYEKRLKGDDGRDVFDHESGAFKTTGEWVEFVVAPDGRILDERRGS